MTSIRQCLALCMVLLQLNGSAAAAAAAAAAPELREQPSEQGSLRSSSRALNSPKVSAFMLLPPNAMSIYLPVSNQKPLHLFLAESFRELVKLLDAILFVWILQWIVWRIVCTLFSHSFRRRSRCCEQDGSRSLQSHYGKLHYSTRTRRYHCWPTN